MDTLYIIVENDFIFLCQLVLEIKSVKVPLLTVKFFLKMLISHERLCVVCHIDIFVAFMGLFGTLNNKYAYIDGL